MASKRTLIVLGVVASFVGLAAVVIAVRVVKLISFELAMLMLVALVGLYLGFGVLIAVHRLLAKLD